MTLEITNELLINNVRFIYTILLVFGIARFLYYPKNGKNEYVLAYCLMSSVIFMLCLLVKNIELGLGFAIGIFAIFGIIRYRTVPISTREMTYLFVVIGIGATNALVPNDVNYLSVFLSHFYIVLILYLLDTVIDRKKELAKKEVIYTDLSLIHPHQRETLIADLKTKYGFEEIVNIKIGKIDEAKQCVKLDLIIKDARAIHFGSTNAQ